MITLPLASAPWKFRDATKKSPWLPAVVPGCVHRALLRHALIPDPFFGTNELDLQWIEHRDWEYATSFNVSAAARAEDTVDLVCDGLDTLATVYLNGRVLARTDNMFITHRWEVRSRLRPGRNDLRIVFASVGRAENGCIIARPHQDLGCAAERGGIHRQHPIEELGLGEVTQARQGHTGTVA